VLFTVAKLWKQPRCPTTDEKIKKMWNLYTMEFYSAMKKNEIFFLNKLDLHFSEMSLEFTYILINHFSIKIPFFASWISCLSLAQNHR
jgi:hypothetical protein